jgi:Na+/proline symporter
MQFGILLIGVLIFSFYLHHKAPVFFDNAKALVAKQGVYKDSLNSVEKQYNLAFSEKKIPEATALRSQYKSLVQKAIPGDDANDTNFIFLRFVKDNLPIGLIGLLFAVIFLSAWGSIAAALNSLAACTVVDFHKKFFVRDETAFQDYKISQWYTFAWGIFCIIIAMFAHNIGNSLIEAVNILGSLFYGVILGIFLVAFWIKRIGANAVFIAAIISELAIIAIYNADVISFLWLNVIGALLVIGIASLVQVLVPAKKIVPVNS